MQYHLIIQHNTIQHCRTIPQYTPTPVPITPTDTTPATEDNTLSTTAASLHGTSSHGISLHGIYPDLELPAMVTSEDFWEAAVRREVEKVTEIVKVESQSVCVESDSNLTAICDLDPTSNDTTASTTASATGTVSATVSTTAPSSSELVTHIPSVISQDSGSDAGGQKGETLGEENKTSTDKEDKGKDRAVILEQQVRHDMTTIIELHHHTAMLKPLLSYFILPSSFFLPTSSFYIHLFSSFLLSFLPSSLLRLDLI